MLLAIDIGNTNITLGLYDGATPGPRWRLSTVHERMPDEYGLQLIGLFDRAGIRADDVAAIALASVVPPLTGTWVELCKT
ncbi:MAG: type III pantothenate kinase, partial [Chloroflexi bacterium]|nr:type III pantothenate kinase [Chloroflexota bacterium]